jgi:predicted transcriptional regulator
VWFTSTESFAKVLSNKNRALLELIASMQPESLLELAARTGRAPMERYGFLASGAFDRSCDRGQTPRPAVSDFAETSLRGV